MNHIGTRRSQSPRENYSLLIIGVSNGDGDGGGVDGDGSGGTSPSRQGAGTETSVPQISPSVATRCGGFRGWRPNDLGFLSREASYRRRGGARRQPGGPDPLVAPPGLA